MEINKIAFENYSFLDFSSGIDYEERMIMAKLRSYGITPTGKKSVDRAKLHEIELREAEKENGVTNKFLTVSRTQQERIQEKKQEKNKDIKNTGNAGKQSLGSDSAADGNIGLDKAMQLFGEQKYISIKINSEIYANTNNDKTADIAFNNAVKNCGVFFSKYNYNDFKEKFEIIPQ